MRAAFDFCVHWHYKVIQCTLSCHTELVFWWIWVRYRRRQNRIFSEVTKLNRIRLVIRCFGDHLRIWAAYDLATCWCNRHQGAQKHLPLTYSAYHREHWRTVRITGNTDVQCLSQGTLTYSAYHREHKCSQFLQYFSGHMLTLCAHFYSRVVNAIHVCFCIQDFLS